jgi:LmbE family N-acetylglucosaminyl deacetylase
MGEAGSGGRKLLIVGAHSGDFVWRAAGAIAVATAGGGEAKVVALSYGERGESGDLWDEPDQPELCGFQPDTFVDITDVFERKLEAMEAMAAQKYMHKHYAERAEHRAFHARYATGDGEVRHAEAFQRVIPQVVRSL